MNDTKEYSSFDIQISLILSQLLLEGALGGLLRFFFHLSLKRATYGTYLFMAIVLAEIVVVFIKNKRGKQILKIAAYTMAYISFMVLFYKLFPATRIYFDEYLDDLIYIALISIPGYYLMKNISDPLLIIQSSKANLRICAMLMPVIYFAGAGEYFGFMSWGSRMLPVSILYSLYNNSSNKPLDRFLFILSIVFTAMGGRQSLVLMVLGLVLSQLIGEKTKEKTIRITIFLSLSIILMLFYTNALQLLSIIMEDLNIQSRSLSALVSGTLFDSSNRMGIYNRCIEIISRNGGKISGLFADRLYLRRYRSNIAYSHNIVLEILIDFGAVVGTIIVLFTLFKMINKWRGIKKEYKALYVQMFLICVARLFVSSSFLISYSMPLFFGFVANYSIMRDNYSRKRIRVRLK